jgi:Prolyl oligopeptidase family
LFYPPHSPDYEASANEKPPLLVKCHGGPTSAASSGLSLPIQFWTSRGIAVLDVNYGGSTGFGRGYRERLYGSWGILDVEDCVNGAKFLAAQGSVDDKRCVISGGSAGGYTTLAALVFQDFFQGGASYYGVSDAAALRSRTPGPPPFSSMNSTPADSNARRIAKSLALVSAVWFSVSSARRMVATLSADAAARSSAVQRIRDRAALI